MKGKKMHSKSKRMTCSKRYKIEKKVREHHRKVRKEEKSNLGKRKTKDPGIPNLYPFKEQLLKQIEEKKQKDEELKKANKQIEQKEKSRKRKLEDLQKDAEKRGNQFAKKQAFETETLNRLKSGPVETSRKSYYKEFRKVVDNADVIIQVLDARDPIGCRCPQLEEMIMASGKNKKLVLMLNKIDLIPKDVVEKWLKHLRMEYPVVAFKASTQNQRQKLSQSKVSVSMASSDLLQSSHCIGAGTLLKLLGNYCRNLDIKTTITVGVVGFPNVGKSSVINSLKRSKACNVGSTPGITKNMQEVQLDQHVKLLDCPGIVMATGTSDTQIILRNAVKVESLDDPVAPVEAILSRCNKEQIMQKYCVPDYTTTIEFLSSFAKRLGKLKKGGIPDQLAAAKVLLQDWNSGKITFYTHPPIREVTEHDTTTVVQYLGAGFDIKALEKEEADDLDGLLSAMDTALVLDPSKPVEMQDMQDEEDASDDASEDDASDDEHIDEDDAIEDLINIQQQAPVITMKVKKKKQPSEGKGKPAAPIDPENNVQLNRDNKKAFKIKKREQRKKSSKLSPADGASITADDDDTYDFAAL